MSKDYTVFAKATKEMEDYLSSHLEQKKMFDRTFIKRQIERRSRGEAFSLQDHIRAVVYSMLSGGISWGRVEALSDPDTGTFPEIDQLFHQYDPDYLLSSDPDTLAQGVKDLGCASYSTWKQMEALLHTNLPKLMELDKRPGGIDGFYAEVIGDSDTPAGLIAILSGKSSRWKLAQMGEALVCEYLKNVGYDIAKPDTHIRRILGGKILGCSEQETVPPMEAVEIVAAIAKELKRPAVEVDYILWSYCATGFGEVCTAQNPKCQICPVRQFCNSKRGE